jgi:hypothetical protein
MHPVHPLTVLISNIVRRVLHYFMLRRAGRRIARKTDGKKRKFVLELQERAGGRNQGQRNIGGVCEVISHLDGQQLPIMWPCAGKWKEINSIGAVMPMFTGKPIRWKTMEPEGRIVVLPNDCQVRHRTDTNNTD